MKKGRNYHDHHRHYYPWIKGTCIERQNKNELTQLLIFFTTTVLFSLPRCNFYLKNPVLCRLCEKCRSCMVVEEDDSSQVDSLFRITILTTPQDIIIPCSISFLSCFTLKQYIRDICLQNCFPLVGWLVCINIIRFSFMPDLHWRINEISRVKYAKLFLFAHV